MPDNLSPKDALDIVYELKALVDDKYHSHSKVLHSKVLTLKFFLTCDLYQYMVQTFLRIQG